MIIDKSFRDIKSCKMSFLFKDYLELIAKRKLFGLIYRNTDRLNKSRSNSFVWFAPFNDINRLLWLWV